MGNRGFVSLMALVLLLAVVLLGLALGAQVKSYARTMQHTELILRLDLAAKSGAERTAVDFMQERLTLGAEDTPISSYCEDGIVTEVYAKAEGDGVILLAVAKEESAKFFWQDNRRNAKAFLAKGDEGYVWGAWLP